MDRAYSLLNVKSFKQVGDVVTVEGMASTPTSDRVNDIMEPHGAKFRIPMPFVLHHDTERPVGNVTFAKATAKGIPFTAELPIVKEPGVVQDRVNEAIHSLKYKLIGAVSIGFKGVSGAVDRLKNGGLHYKEWDWLELSLVTIPANPEAVITGLKSIDDALRAATGRKRSEVTSPGDTGTKRTAPGRFFSARSKGNEMKSLQELRELRTQKAARLQELVELFKSDAHEDNDDENTEFDALNIEVKALDQDIRIKGFEETQAKAATAVRGGNSDEGSRSRSSNILVRKEDPEDAFKGQSYTRVLVAKAAAFMAMKGGAFVSPVDVAQHRWGKTHPKLVQYIKTAVAGGGTGSGEWGAELAQSDTRFTGDFVEFLYSKTVFDALPLRSIPARVHIKGQDGAATGYWVGESKAIPVSKPDFSDVELTPLKVGALAVCSKELVADSSPSAELWIRDSIAQASAQRIDTTFLSATAASAGVSPAGILNGVSALAPSGADAAAIRADFQSLVFPFIGAKNASGLVSIMTPSMAMAISMSVNALGQPDFPSLLETGGTLLGRPVFTGDNVTPGDWIVLKPSDIWKIGDGGVDISMSDSAMVEQNDAPTGATDTPVAASATMVSLWQEESIGFKVVRRINYAKRRAGAVTLLSNAEYGGVVS